MTTYEPNKQRVWIELEVPAIIEKPDGPLTHSQKEAKALGNFVPDIPARRVLMEARAKLASNMLRRLGVEGRRPHRRDRRKRLAVLRRTHQRTNAYSDERQRLVVQSWLPGA